MNNRATASSFLGWTLSDPQPAGGQGVHQPFGYIWKLGLKDVKLLI